MKLGKRLVCLSCIAVVGMGASGCPGDDDPFVPPRFDANLAPDATWADAAPPADAEPAADVVMDPEGPSSVTLIYPTDTDTLLDDRHVFRCHAEANVQSMSPVTEVRFEFTDRTGSSPRVAIGSPIGGDDYTATVDLSGLLNGILRVQCIATGSDGHQNGDENVAHVDLGPRIIVVSPATGSFVHGTINVDFSVVPDPVFTPDPEDGIATVTARIAGRPITTLNAGTHYTATVATNDPMLFDPPLAGPSQLLVRATNDRGATRETLVPFTVDDTGPTIVITNPVPGQLVGGVITVTASITDPAIVDSSTVVAVFGNGPIDVATFELSPTGMPGEFSGTYDSRELREAVAILFPGIDIVFPTLSVRATDLVGNEANVGIVVVIDYMPPLASLDPPMMREAKEDRLEGTIECSREFDPLGDDAVNDGQEVAQLFELRARIEDRGNGGFSTSSVPLFTAGVNAATAQFFILDNTDETVGATGDAILVDTNDDGICDEINPMIAPTIAPMGMLLPDEALAVNLAGVIPHGEFFYQAEDGCDPTFGTCPAGAYAGYPDCDFAEEAAVPPPRLCAFTGLQRALAPEFGLDPVIFTIPPIIDDFSCLGLPLDASNHIEDGWACVVVRVEDNLGNVGVSKPLRICIDKDDDDADGCPGDPWYPISVDQTDDETDVPIVPIDTSRIDPSSPSYIDCTGTYLPPSASNPDGVTISSMDCQVPDFFFQFPQNEMRMRREL